MIGTPEIPKFEDQDTEGVSGSPVGGELEGRQVPLEGDPSGIPKFSESGAVEVDVPPTEAKPMRETDKTALGFAKNVIPSTFRTMKEIGTGIVMAPVQGAAEGVKLAKELRKPMRPGYDRTEVLKDWWDNIPKLLGDALVEKYADKYEGVEKDKDGKVIARHRGEWIKNPETGHYEKHEKSLAGAVGDAAYEDPAGVALDLSAAKDLVASTGKAIGKAAGSKGLVEASSKLGSLEGDLAKAAFQKVAPQGVVDYLAHRKEVLRLKGEEMARVPVEKASDEAALMPTLKKLTDEERVMVGEVQRLGEGASPEALAAVKAKPEMLQAVEDYRAYLRDTREPWMKETGVITDKGLRQRVEMQYAVEKFGEITPETMGWARRDIGKMKDFKPVYVPTEAELRGGIDLMKSIGEPLTVVKQGKVGFLERFTGSRPISHDPAQYVPRVIDSFRRHEGNVRWIQRIHESPDLVRAVTSKEARAESLIPTEGIYKKYLDEGGKFRSKKVYQEELVREHGYEKAMDMLARDAAIQKRWRAISGIVAQPAVKHILQMEFSKWAQTPGALLRAYDKLIGLFRASATKWNPHYYSGNAVGDAVLSLVAGSSPADMRLAERLKAYAPNQALRSASVHAGDLTGKFQTLYDYINDVDAAGKRAIVTKDVARGLKDMGVSAFHLEDELKKVLPAIEELGDVEVTRGVFHEKIAKRVEAISDLAKQERRLRDELAELANRGHKTKAERKAFRDLNERYVDLKAQKEALIEKYEEKLVDGGILEKQLPELKERAAMVRPAVERANQFFADYLGAGPIQQYVFRRIIPFFAFNKAMATLAFKLPFIAPKMGFLWNRYSAVMMSMAGDDELPSYLHGYVPMFVSKDGKTTTWASIKGLSPFGGLRMSKFAGTEIPAFADFTEQNPLISTIASMKGGKNTFQRTSLPYGEGMVNVHSGDVYQLQEDGSVKKTIPQVGFWKGVSRMFPTVGLAERILFPYEMSDKGWLLEPEGRKTRKGEYENPHDWQDAIRDSLGLRMIEKKDSEMNAIERRRVKNVAQGFQEAMRKAPPEERENLREQMRDFLKVRKIKGND